jgi:hypothetical protein
MLGTLVDSGRLWLTLEELGCNPTLVQREQTDLAFEAGPFPELRIGCW